jgi:hypothetical protein
LGIIRETNLVDTPDRYASHPHRCPAGEALNVLEEGIELTLLGKNLPLSAHD